MLRAIIVWLNHELRLDRSKSEKWPVKPPLEIREVTVLCGENTCIKPPCLDGKDRRNAHHLPHSLHGVGWRGVE